MAVTTTLPSTGCLPFFLPAQKDVVQVVSTRPTRICGWALYNPNSSTAYVLFFDSIVAVILGTTVPKFVMPLPTGVAANMLDGRHPVWMENGLQIACATTALGSTPPTTGLDVTVFVQ